MANKINGDFDLETIEAFRAAYAAQLQTPEDQEIDEYTRLPTNVVANTAPWIQHTGLWRANPGNLNDFVPNQVLVAPESNLESEEDEELTEEEIEQFLDEILGDEYDLEDEEDEDSEILQEVEDMLALMGSGEDDEMEFYGDEENEYDEDGIETEVEVELSEDEIDELIDSLQQEIEESLEAQI